jgi:hypothetical protein
MVLEPHLLIASNPIKGCSSTSINNILLANMLLAATMATTGLRLMTHIQNCLLVLLVVTLTTSTFVLCNFLEVPFALSTAFFRFSTFNK